MLSTAPISQNSLFFTCEWFPSEQKLLLPQEELSTAEWAERFRYVVKSSRPGPWRNANNPPLVGIMNAADRKGMFRNMRTEVIIKGVQTGVTEGGYNILFKRMDGRAHNALLVMENERKVRKVSKERVQVDMRATRRLADQMSENPDDTTNYSITLRSGYTLNIGWSGSQASVASFPCETVLLDEVDKYEDGMNIEEAKDRITTYRDTGLVAIFSTPGLDGGPIIVELNNCDTIMDFHVACPDCGHVQVMEWDHFWWPGKGDKLKPGEWKAVANRALREKSARYACGGCGSLWDDYQRDEAVRLGEKHFFHGWKMREEIENPVSIGFKFPSWISPFKSLSDVAARFLRAQEPGQPDKLRAWHNNEAAEAYVEQKSERKSDAILLLRDNRPRGIVPKDTAALILTADTQQRGFFYEVAALGWGLLLPTWQVREGYVETFEGLEEILYNSEYKDADGKPYSIIAGAIDSGGGTGTVPKHSRTSEVYSFCLKNPIMRPIKGRQMMTHPVSSTKIDFFPGTKIPIPGGLTLYLLNVTYFKDMLLSKLSINPEDPGAWLLHSECTEDYAKQMVAEYRDGKGRWQCPKGKANHFWDNGVYRLGLAEILQVKFWRRPEERAATQGRRVRSQGVQA